VVIAFVPVLSGIAYLVGRPSLRVFCSASITNDRRKVDHGMTWQLGAYRRLGPASDSPYILILHNVVGLPCGYVRKPDGCTRHPEIDHHDGTIMLTG
jgi:hypothetical protein